MEFLVLGLVAGIGVASLALWQRARRAEHRAAESEPKRLVAPAERSPMAIEVGDVVQHLGSDYLVEGTVTFKEEGRTMRLYRLFDDGGEQFLYVKAGGGEPLLLAPAAAPDEGREPPDRLERDGVSYRQFARARATAAFAGQLAGRQRGTDVRLFEYSGPGPERALTIEWTRGVFETLVGQRILPTTLEILPGA